MNDFQSLGLPRPLLQALEKMKFDKPTPIQAQSIPPALEGRDVLGTAQTGTGKTAAFAIPLIARLLQRIDERGHHGHHEPHGQQFHAPKHNGIALVMTPTRELAMQVNEAVKLMLSHAQHIKTALLIGGQSMGNQLQQLRARPRVIVGTPGRINDHLQQGSLNLSACDFLVLDETDRMLDMGFGPQIDRIVKRMPKQRQTLMFSATMPDHIVKVSQQYLDRPVRVAVGAVNQPIKAIKQEVKHMQIPEKFGNLVKELQERQGSVIVFVKTKRGADRIAKKLNDEKLHAAAIHGNLNQNQRNRVIQAFRDRKHRVMVATDVAARGLDIPHIEHVINYDLPQVAEDYIHRIGRTARAGKEGEAVCFITPEDSDLWREIHKLLHPGEKPPPRAEGAVPQRQGGQRQGGQRQGGQRRGGGNRQGRGPRRDGQRDGNREDFGGRRESRGGHGRRDEHRAERRDEHRGERRNEHHGERRNEHHGERRTDHRDGHRDGPKRHGHGHGQRRERGEGGEQGENRVFRGHRSSDDRNRVGHNRSGFAHRKGRKTGGKKR